MGTLSALKESLCLSHKTQISFLYSPHNLHPIPKNFHVHRKSTIGMSHKVEIREFSLEREKINDSLTLHNNKLSLQSEQLIGPSAPTNLFYFDVNFSMDLFPFKVFCPGKEKQSTSINVQNSGRQNSGQSFDFFAPAVPLEKP